MDRDAACRIRLATVRRVRPAPLGDSEFNYDDYSAVRWLHYGQQVNAVMEFQPQSVLEVGPGDNTVADFLSRKNILVETIDRDPALLPTWVGDVRDPLPCDRRYDVVLASEILEHMPYERSLEAIGNLLAVLEDRGAVIVSVPYTTARLFPRRPDYGRFVSPEGRLHTGVPARWGHRVLWLGTLVRAVARRELRDVGRPGKRDVAPDDVSLHHWDLGDAATSIRRVRRDLSRIATVTSLVRRRDTNCVFLMLGPRHRKPGT